MNKLKKPVTAKKYIWNTRERHGREDNSNKINKSDHI